MNNYYLLIPYIGPQNIIVDNSKMKNLIGITFPVWTFCTIFMMLDLPVEMSATQSITTADFVHVTKARLITKYNS